MKKDEVPKVTSQREIRFDLAEDDVPFAQVLVEELEATYSGHTLMPPDVGNVVVSDINAIYILGKVTLFD
jgi:hypothetical protein